MTKREKRNGLVALNGGGDVTIPAPNGVSQDATDSDMPAQKPKKVCIAGFCESSRALIPYDEPDCEIWGLNNAYVFMRITPNVTRWFEPHGPHLYTWPMRRPAQHTAWLKAFPGPVYMQQADPNIPNSLAMPLEEMTRALFGRHRYARFGVVDKADKEGKLLPPPQGDYWAGLDESPLVYFNSSIAYMIGMAIMERYDEIRIIGIDLSTAGEYAWQKANCEVLLTIAMERGIRVLLPTNCPLLYGKLYGRGFLAEEGDRMTPEQLQQRYAQLEQERQKSWAAANQFMGAAREVNFLLEGGLGVDEQQPYGLVLKALQKRKSAVTQSVEQAQAQAQQHLGAMKEIEGLIGSLMRFGQQPIRAMCQTLRKRQRKLAEGMDQHIGQVNQMQGAVNEARYWIQQTPRGMTPEEFARNMLRDGAQSEGVAQSEGIPGYGLNHVSNGTVRRTFPPMADETDLLTADERGMLALA